MLALVVAVVWPSPKAEAFDPVTIAILAPVAMRVAKVASPYIIRGLLNSGKCMLKMGKDVLEFFYFPMGICQMSFGWPWNGFRPGLRNVIKGCIAPGKLVFHSLLLPVYMIGIELNI